MEVSYGCSKSYIYLLLIMMAVAVAVAATSGDDVVELKAYENGSETDYVKPGQSTTLNCTFKSEDAIVLAITNGTGKQIVKWDIKNRGPEVLPDFRSRVSNINKDTTDTDGWLSFDFYYPYCYRDGVVKCEVFDGSAHSDKKDFPIGEISKPVIEASGDYGTFLCIATRVAPQVNFAWSEVCEEIEEEVNEDVPHCLFNQTSHATCTVTRAETRTITCTITNTIGSESGFFPIEGLPKARRAADFKP